MITFTKVKSSTSNRDKSIHTINYQSYDCKEVIMNSF